MKCYIRYVLKLFENFGLSIAAGPVPMCSSCVAKILNCRQLSIFEGGGQIVRTEVKHLCACCVESDQVYFVVFSSQLWGVYTALEQLQREPEVFKYEAQATLFKYPVRTAQ